MQVRNLPCNSPNLIMDNFEAINICKQVIQLVINVLKLLDCPKSFSNVFFTAVHLHTNPKIISLNSKTTYIFND